MELNSFLVWNAIYKEAAGKFNKPQRMPLGILSHSMEQTLPSPVYSYIENRRPCMHVRFQPLIVFAPYTYHKSLRGRTVEVST